jgi:chemotaxis protein CheX
MPNMPFDSDIVSSLVAPVVVRSSVNAKFLNVFLKAAIDVLVAEVGGPVERGQVSLYASNETSDEVNVILTLVGKVHGVVIYSLSRSTALGIVSRIMGMPMVELDELAQSGVSELGNVITGRASILLESAGYVTNISVPMLVVGKASISIINFQRLVVPLQSPVGPIAIHLAVRESTP